MLDVIAHSRGRVLVVSSGVAVCGPFEHLRTQGEVLGGVGRGRSTLPACVFVCVCVCVCICACAYGLPTFLNIQGPVLILQSIWFSPEMPTSKLAPFPSVTNSANVLCNWTPSLLARQCACAAH